MRIGTRVNDGVWLSIGHIERGINMDNIMLSKQSRAEIRWVR